MVSVPGARQEAFDCMEDVVLSWDGDDEVTWEMPADDDDADIPVNWVEDAREKGSLFLTFFLGSEILPSAGAVPQRSGPRRGARVAVGVVRSLIQLSGFPTLAHAPPPQGA